MNLIEGLHQQMNRVREIIKIYDEYPTGVFAATMMRESIKAAEVAIEQGDTIEMMRCYSDLEEYDI